MSSDLDDIVQEFLVESHENLDHLDQALLALEADEPTQEKIAGIFRAIHTLKGTCGFLGFSRLEKLSHVGENLLSRMRDGTLPPAPPITDALLRMLDLIREMLASIEATGQEGDAPCEEVIRLLNELQGGVSEPPAPSVDACLTTPAGDDSLEDLSPESSCVDDKVTAGPANASSTALQRNSDKPAANLQSSETAIRVDVKVLDKLMVLVGELVLVRNRLQQHASSLGTSPLVSSTQRLNWITSELQESVMKTRMQPIGSTWSKFPRIVRELALACGKQVTLEMDGLETELDRSLIEAIKDPFIHLLRNAIDHGVETPEVRAARGKPTAGRIWLRAYHEGGQVNIDIADDGAGICVDHIRQKAVDRGLVSQDRASRMNDNEALRLIFCPGFSTAEQITNVSGRGVGMDVVKANIERIGGTIDVSSQPEVGTTIRIKIPLTLAIIPALIIGRETTRFAIPQVNLLELVRLEGDEARTAIEYVHEAPVYRLRGDLLPLVYLAKELHLPDLKRNDPAVNILVVQADDLRFGLIVDDILDTAEIVVKPLDKILHGTRVFAGTTILGDGKLALILDILNIAKSASLISASHQRAASHSRHSHSAHVEAAGQPSSRQTLLVFEAEPIGRMAIPLSSVTRLEEFPSSQIEQIGQRLVVQYRGRIMPLLDIGSILAGNDPSESVCEGGYVRDGGYVRQNVDEPSPIQRSASLSASSNHAIPVVVSTERDQPCGFVVKRILDIVEQDVEFRGASTQTTVLYSAVIQGRVTEVVDIAALREWVATTEKVHRTCPDDLTLVDERPPCKQVPS